MGTRPSSLGWRIPWTEEPGRLQSTGLQKVGHDGETKTMEIIVEVSQKMKNNIIKYFLNHIKAKLYFQGKKHTQIHKVKCPTLCNPMDCSLPGSSTHEIFQARVLEWVAIPFSYGESSINIYTLLLLLSHFSRVRLCATP